MCGNWEGERHLHGVRDSQKYQWNAGCGHAPLKFQHWGCWGRRVVASLGCVGKPVSRDKAQITTGNSTKKADIMFPRGWRWPADFRSPSKQKALKYSAFGHQGLWSDIRGSQIRRLTFLGRAATVLSGKTTATTKWMAHLSGKISHGNTQVTKVAIHQASHTGGVGTAAQSVKRLKG